MPDNVTAAAAHEAAGPAGAPAGDRVETKFPRGLVIRLFAYLFAGHAFAAFLYLLFELGSRSNP
ncbi:DUF6126 family protein [Streptomyces sp. NPDC101118]|uniref:DUF6126 family protein n=1 Tax=Streptomyces sp. NPDC101118 TaxID=3366109 RepID=UPI00381A7EB0